MSHKLAFLESLQCRVFTVLTANGITDAEIQKVAKSAKRRKDAVQWSGDQLQELTRWRRELAEDLQAAYQDGLTYNLKLVALLRFAEAMMLTVDNWTMLQADALADIEQLRVAVERMTDPTDEECRIGRGMKLQGATWPDITESVAASLDFNRDKWPTMRKRVVEWDKANGCQIPTGKPGTPKRNQSG